LRLARRRRPPQQLLQVRREWEALRQRRHPWLEELRKVFAPARPDYTLADPEGEMIAEANRAIAHHLRRQSRRTATPPSPPPRALLDSPPAGKPPPHEETSPRNN